MQTLTFNRSIDQLEANLISLARRRNEVEYEFLKAVQEFDIRQGWRLWHLNNCAEWLNLKCGIAPGTAREKVRVAAALFDLPKCAAAFARGELSYSKARSLTRIATPDTEAELLNHALESTASQVQSYCHQVRNGSEASTDDANRVHRTRWLSCSDDGDGMMSLSATLPKEAADLVMKAIELAATRLEADYCDAAEGNPLELGRKKRVVSPQLKRVLLTRDKHCRYPGCTHTRWLDAHHVMHWAEGGETTLDNCILLCSKHHRLLHEGGYTIEKNYKGERYLKTNNGKCIVEPAQDDASRDAREGVVAEPRRLYAVG